MLDGLSIGHVTRGDTGVTVIYCGPEGALASGDVRGGGPGTRETDLLEPANTVERVHAVVLAGGSAFGLAAANGVMQELADAHIGFPVFGPDRPGPRVPIVPGAVIFDLIVGETVPTAADGRAACQNALRESSMAEGNVGAGAGATAGKLRGGFGIGRAQAGGHEAAAAVVCNPVGEVVDARTGRLFGAPERAPIDVEALAALPAPEAHLNTTIGVVATTAPITKAQAKRLAMSSHDGIARAVRPSHLPLDGDTLFALSTATEPTGLDPEVLTAVCAAGEEAVACAIVHAVCAADPGYGWQSYSNLGAQ